MTDTKDSYSKRIDVAIDRLEEALDQLAALCDERPVAGPARLEEASKRLPPEAHKLMYAMAGRIHPRLNFEISATSRPWV